MRKGGTLKTEALKKQACEHIDQRRDEMIGIAQRMLKQPELGYREVKTAALVKEELQKLNLPIREGLALTGVEGTLAGKEAGPAVVVMGELDSVMERNRPWPTRSRAPRTSAAITSRWRACWAPPWALSVQGSAPFCPER